MERFQLLEGWIGAQFPDTSYALSPASADASFRRYYRLAFGGKREETLIVMDAPPPRENCVSFLHVARLFTAAGVHVPAILARDLAQGFLLLSDLGSVTYLDALTQDPGNADDLYGASVAALLNIQLSSRSGALPNYDESLLLQELELFPDWYLQRHLQVALDPQQKLELEVVFAQLVQSSLAQPQVFVHRDYHSRNLMVTAPNPGILDFQDAVYGPITYDLVSLFKDAYIRWEEERVLDWVIRYWEKARKLQLPVPTDFADFYRDFEWMGVQRHLKIAGIFARLFHRDGKDAYLKDVPLVMRYLRSACGRYRQLYPLLALLDTLEDKPADRIGYTF